MKEMLIQNKKKLRRELLSDGSSRIKKNIAILGGYTTNDIKLTLEIHLLRYGIEPAFYESEYNMYYEDAIFGNEKLDDFHPDVVYICTSNRNIISYPSLALSEQEVDALLGMEFGRWESIWASISEKYGCIIIQNNFEYPYMRLLGNMDAVDVHGAVNFINTLNARFAKHARNSNNFFINDISYQSACYGLDEWSDPFYWYMYKYAVAVPAIPYLTFNIANIIKSLYGKNKKAFVLDLDNTLWGGVIGDDGVEGIELGQEGAKGQAYSEFQEYIKSHKDIGVLICVSSKNDYENAVSGLEHPDSVLSPDDFVSIKANWEPKSGNIEKIANELNLLPESLVFVDDNPAERAIVEAQLPGVAIPHIERAEHYLRDIDRMGYFESTGISADDILRNEMYRQNAKREEYVKSFSNYEEYLRSLEMKANIKQFDTVSIPRVVQLINKSNQFNLTTERYAQTDIEKIANDDSYIGISGRLIDKFGDNGIVSVVIGEVDSELPETLNIKLWVMSCRVLKRDMEYAMMDELADRCRRLKINEIKGYYYPTKKNEMVRDFYRHQGFSKVGEDEFGNTVWLLQIGDVYQKKNMVIDVGG